MRALYELRNITTRRAEKVDERRNYVRKSLSSTVSVFDRNTNEYIGLVADWSEDGLLVTSSVNPIHIGGIYEYMLLSQSPNGSDATDRAQLDAESVWCERTSPSFYGTGFWLKLITPEARYVLEKCSHIN